MPSICTLDELATDPALAGRAGGKATRLAQMRAAGLPVLNGVVVFEDPGGACAHAARLGAERFVVRSSSGSEDAQAAAAPGVFDSFTSVKQSQLASRIEDVFASKLGSRARAYAEAMAVPFPAPMAVLVQPHLESSQRGTLYTRSSVDSTNSIIESSSGQRLVSSLPAVLGGARPAFEWLSANLLDALLAAASEIEELFDFYIGADVEWLIADGALWIVQARPMSRYPSEQRQSPPPDAFAFTVDSSRTWALDIGHNPEPLSLAQRGLVELIARELEAPLEIVCGYLYQEVVEAPPIEPSPTPQAPARLEALFFEDIAPRLDNILDDAERAAPDIERALTCYVDVNRIYAGELRPTLQLARRACKDKTSGPIGVELLTAIAEPRTGFGASARSYAQRLASLGDHNYWSVYSQKWDISAPCFEESAEELEALVVRLAGLVRLGARASTTFEGTAMSRLVHAISELDDRWFYRAQRLVRRATAALEGEPGGAHRFDLSLLTLRAWAEGGTPPANAIELAARNRADRVEAASLSMPLRVGEIETADQQPGDAAVFCGQGTGGKCVGSVTREVGREHAVVDAILVAADLSPGDIIRAMSSTAILLGRGHLLGHAAALARELGIPIIVGIGDSLSALREGDRVWLDGGAGVAVRLPDS